MVIPIPVINMNIDFHARLLSNSFFLLFIFLLYLIDLIIFCSFMVILVRCMAGIITRNLQLVLQLTRRGTEMVRRKHFDDFW